MSKGFAFLIELCWSNGCQEGGGGVALAALVGGGEKRVTDWSQKA
jgi:hypothetical protein